MRQRQEEMDPAEIAAEGRRNNIVGYCCTVNAWNGRTVPVYRIKIIRNQIIHACSCIISIDDDRQSFSDPRYIDNVGGRGKCRNRSGKSFLHDINNSKNSCRQTTTTATTNVIIRFSIRNRRTVSCDQIRMGTIARKMHCC